MVFDKGAFAGKRILVTGAGSGIGRSASILLSNLGAEIILVSRNSDKLQNTLGKLQGTGHLMVPFDVTEFDRYEDLFAQSAEIGKLDGLLHCAGIARAIPLKAVSVSAMDEMMHTNFYSFVMLTKYFSKKRYSNDGSAIVGCSAVNAYYPQKCMSVYQASKAALDAVVRGLADELYDSRKIRINSMIIGPMATPMGGCDNEDLSLVGQHSEITPNIIGIGDPVKVAQMAAFLLHEVSDYTTGRSLYVDGGRL